jgi:glutamate formiminotransferase/glutamate formiminotransferase/formiminotetrahydrofolate cyclodeaminase
VASEAVEVVMRAVRAWARNDMEAVLELFEPDAELDLSRLELPDARLLRGTGDMREFFDTLFASFDELAFEPADIAERGGWVLVKGRIRGRSQTVGLVVEHEFSEALLVRGGRIRRDVWFRDPAEADAWVDARGGPLLVAVPNLSEGRDLARLERLEAAVGPARVLDVHTDPDHNRAVFTLAGRQGELAAGLVALACAAAREIDLREHDGIHPHVGALDVMPVVWRSEEERGAACAAALTAAALAGERAGMPVFLYGDLSTRPEHAERAWIRRGGPAELARRMEAGELVPDYGPPRPHASAGATLATARPPLLAFNLDLDSDDLGLARRIAAGLRESGGGPAGVRALGLYLEERGCAQVSTNVHDHRAVPLREIVERVRAQAPVAEAELVGLAPRGAFKGFPTDVPLRGFSPERHILEEALAALE